MTKELIVKRTKQIGGIVIGIGVGAIVGNAVKFTTPAEIGRITKACVGVGSLLLGGLAADATSKYFNACIDDGVAMAEEIMNEVDAEVVVEPIVVE